MARLFSTLIVSALCLGLAALTAGCFKDGPAPEDGDAAPDSGREAPQDAARPGRGENFFEQEKTKYFPVRFLHKDIIEIHDKWRPDQADDELGYFIGDERLDNVVKLIARLDDLDDAALQHGVVLVQESKDKRPGWQQDVKELCTFAEFQNINLFLNVPTSTASPDETAGKHVFWLVRETKPQASSPAAAESE